MRAFNVKARRASWHSRDLLHWYAEVDWNDPHHTASAHPVADLNQILLDVGLPNSPADLPGSTSRSTWSARTAPPTFPSRPSHA